MKSVRLLLASFLLSAMLVSAQEFSAKPNTSGDEVIKLKANTLDAEGVTLRQLLQIAYNLPGTLFIGPGWLDEPAYDVHAVSPQGQPLGPHLQKSLLAQFKLATKAESRPVNVWVLKPVPGVEPTLSKPPTPSKSSEIDARVEGKALTMATIASHLSQALNRPVIDETGLHGRYDVHLSYDPSDPASVVEAVRKQLGLDLKTAVRPRDVLVVSRQN